MNCPDDGRHGLGPMIISLRHKSGDAGVEDLAAARRLWFKTTLSEGSFMPLSDEHMPVGRSFNVKDSNHAVPWEGCGDDEDQQSVTQPTEKPFQCSIIKIGSRPSRAHSEYLTITGHSWGYGPTIARRASLHLGSSPCVNTSRMAQLWCNSVYSSWAGEVLVLPSTCQILSDLGEVLSLSAEIGLRDVKVTCVDDERSRVGAAIPH